MTATYSVRCNLLATVAPDAGLWGRGQISSRRPLATWQHDVAMPGRARDGPAHAVRILAAVACPASLGAREVLLRNLVIADSSAYCSDIRAAGAKARAIG